MKTALLLLLSLVLSAATAVAAPPRILFDEGHGQRFRTADGGDLDLTLLAGQAQKAGGQVAAIRRIDAATLAGAAGLVLSGPFHPYRESEIAAILAFVDGGGRLAIMLHVAPPAASLLARLGLRHSNGVVRENAAVLENQPLNFQVQDLAPHPVFAGIESFAVFGAWALDAADQREIIARTSRQAWIDLDGNERRTAPDAAGAFGLAAAGSRGKGAFIVFGDDAIFQNRYLRQYNGALGDRLAHWLLGKP